MATEEEGDGGRLAPCRRLYVASPIFSLSRIVGRSVGRGWPEVSPPLPALASQRSPEATAASARSHGPSWREAEGGEEKYCTRGARLPAPLLRHCAAPSLLVGVSWSEKPMPGSGSCACGLDIAGISWKGAKPLNKSYSNIYVVHIRQSNPTAELEEMLCLSKENEKAPFLKFHGMPAVLQGSRCRVTRVQLGKLSWRCGTSISFTPQDRSNPWGN